MPSPGSAATGSDLWQVYAGRAALAGGDHPPVRTDAPQMATKTAGSVLMNHLDIPGSPRCDRSRRPVPPFPDPAPPATAAWAIMIRFVATRRAHPPYIKA